MQIINLHDFLTTFSSNPIDYHCGDYVLQDLLCWTYSWVKRSVLDPYSWSLWCQPENLPLNRHCWISFQYVVLWEGGMGAVRTSQDLSNDRYFLSSLLTRECPHDFRRWDRSTFADDLGSLKVAPILTYCFQGSTFGSVLEDLWPLYASDVVANGAPSLCTLMLNEAHRKSFLCIKSKSISMHSMQKN